MSFSENRECAAEVETDSIPTETDHGGEEAEVETETDVSQVRDGGNEEIDYSNTSSVADYILGISPSKGITHSRNLILLRS